MSLDLYKHSIEVIRSGQTSAGSFIACPSFKTYHYCWLRDGSFIAYGMDCAGEHDSARAYHRWVHDTLVPLSHKVDQLVAKAANQQSIDPQEWLHCRYKLDGVESDEEWGNFQLDGYGTWLWSLSEHVRMTGETNLLQAFAGSIDLVVRYLAQFWDRPNFDCWEEHGDQVHPSTLACLYGGLMAINTHLNRPEVATVCVAIKTYLLEHFVHTLDGATRLTKFADGRSIDSNLLWVTVPFDLLPPTSPIIIDTVTALERLCVTGGAHRYPEDTYYGGGEWLLLTAWLGWYYVRVGNIARAQALLTWIEAQADLHGDLTEQVQAHVNDPSMVQEWVERWGPVATPLLWSHAMYLVLLAEVTAHGTR